MPPSRATAWRAVFSPPEQGLELLGDDEDPWRQWSRGVCHMAAGDYAGGFHLFHGLVGGDDEVAGLAAAAIASGMRQLGDHAPAQTWDDAAIASRGAGRIDGLIGAAADRVGVSDASGARLALQRARPELSGWRDRVRFAWVSAELALLSGDAEAAVAHSRQAVEAAHTAGSPRHMIKSQLFAAVSLQTREPGSGVQGLHDVAARAARLSLRVLLWPAVLALATDATAAELRAAESAAAFIESHRPPGVGERWHGAALLPHG